MGFLKKLAAGGIMLVLFAAVLPGLDLFYGGKIHDTLQAVYGQVHKRTILPGTLVKKEDYYLCGDVELISQDIASAEYVGRSSDVLMERYPENEGWSGGWDGERVFVLRKSNDCLCPRHSLYRHLGVSNNRLTVYEGPLGYDRSIVRVEAGKDLASLPPDLQEKLQKAAEYHRLPPGEKESLRRDLEFIDEAAVNSALENLDELYW